MPNIRRKRSAWIGLIGVFLCLTAAFWSDASLAGETGTGHADVLWWTWPLGLFFVCFIMGMLAVPAGVGGGVLFVPIIGGFFPFHLDFVRGAGLLVALASAISAGPTLLRNGLADLRLALPLSLVASVGSIIGARVGLALPTSMVNITLGITILAIVLIMAFTGRAEWPLEKTADGLGRRLAIGGSLFDTANGEFRKWGCRNIGWGMLLFGFVGLMGGIFGVGAGWANVPLLNLLIGVPLKIAAGTSGLILSFASSSASWVYIQSGAVIPMIAAPAVIGVMLGAQIGARLLWVLKPVMIRHLVMAVLLFAGVRALLKGFGPWS